LTKPKNCLPSYRYKLLRVRKKCTQELIAQIGRYVALGVPVSTTCRKVKLSRQLFYLWRRKGYKYLRSGIPSHHAPYGAFVEAIEEAEADYEINIIKRSFVGREYAPNWRQDRQLLIRINPEDWGTINPRRVGGPDLRFL
jgi:hypothetical protein